MPAAPALAQQDQIGPLIRDRRRRLGLTLQELGERAGVSVGYLSQVERNNATPSLGTLAQIAKALNVALEYFVRTPSPSDGLTRQDSRIQFSVGTSQIGYEQLGADLPGAMLSSYIIDCPPGFSSESQQHEGEEVLYVLEGEIEHTLGQEVFPLQAGDSLHFRGSVPHSWRNVSDSPARLLWVGTLEVLHSAGKMRLPLRVAEP